jgi:hypothetical protein
VPPPHYVVFDVETRRSAAEVGGWNRADRMGVSVAVAYDSQADDFFSYEQEALPALFERLQAAQLVIGFNSLRFDYAVLRPFAPFDLRGLPSLDLLQRVNQSLNYRVSLDNLGQATLGEPKSANGLLALGRLGPADAGCLAQAVTDVEAVLGLLDPADLPLPRRDWPSEAARLVAERHKARAARDFPLADRLRTDIARLGYRVEDTVDGCRLYPVT